MHDSIFKLIILAGIIIICIGILWYTKKTKEGFEDATESGTLPLDASNPNLTPDQYYGSIALAATISLFKSHELTKATANPDNIPVSEGDPKTGAGAGMYITLTDIPPQTPPPDDIEVVLNKVTEGFLAEGFLAEGFLAEGFIDAEQTANILAQNQANSIKAALTPEQLQARAQQEAQAKAQAIAEEKTATALSKTEAAPLAAAYVLNIGVGLAALALVPVPLFFCLRRLVAPMILLYEFAVLGKVASLGVRGAVALIVAGTLLAGADTLRAGLLGYAL